MFLKDKNTMVNPVCIVVPIYKENPTNTEKTSFKQLLRVLATYDIIIYTYKELDISVYYEEALSLNKTVRVEYFDKNYFASVTDYNRLCLTTDFYKRVSSYNYMLIYQLDAWVFCDELEYWCDKGYDYIGAPWFTKFGAYEDGDNLWAVGNGGLSLRKISFFIRMLSYKWPITCAIELKKGILVFIKSLFKSLGMHNTMKFWIRANVESINEDWFLSNFFKFTKNRCLIPFSPSPEEAAKFSFEKSPRYLYELCGNKLPFGCHAFEKYEFETFWKRFIEL